MAASKKRMVFIDADSILYQAALMGETECDGEKLQLLDISYIIKECDSRIENVVEASGAERAYICLSDRTNFRHRILPSYKGNRKPTARPMLLDQLRAHYVENEGIHPAMLIKDLEADDVCCILADTFRAQGYDPVVASPDKDLLQSPGLLLSRRGSNWVWSEVDEEYASRHHIYQTLAGDPVDGYKGCPGWGSKKANRLLDYYEGLPEKDRWVAVVEAFETRGLTEADALVQARVARMTRLSDWDQTRKEVIWWNPPK